MTRNSYFRHGLHTPGAGNGDDVTREVAGGDCLEYVWHVEDYGGGTNWYHPHQHGDTKNQVSGGAFGLIVIEDTTYPGDWAKPENEILLAISALGGGSGVKGNGISNEPM